VEGPLLWWLRHMFLMAPAFSARMLLVSSPLTRASNFIFFARKQLSATLVSWLSFLIQDRRESAM
jgi:hypothetical protein